MILRDGNRLRNNSEPSIYPWGGSVTSTGDLTYNRLWLVPALFVLLPHVHPQHRDGHPSFVDNDDKWTSRKVCTRPHVVSLRRWTVWNPVKGHAIRDDELVSDKEEKVTRSTTSTVNACSFYLRHINQISCFFNQTHKGTRSQCHHHIAA